MQLHFAASQILWAVLSVRGAEAPATSPEPPWAAARGRPAMTAEETRAFMMRLARYVEANHLRKDRSSAMAGMVYEYADTRGRGKPDRFVQGEALDTMHDGAWLAAAMATAYRATGDLFYRDFLTEWQLPFYLKMLNHSHELFTARRNDARTAAPPFDREHALQEGEKGFVPYFWDDGRSISLERRRDKNPLGPFPCADRLAGKRNSRYLLDGYSLGSSNHLAQDVGVMLLVSWLLVRESGEAGLRDELRRGAESLQECRMRHHGHIPMCDAPAAVARGDAQLLKHVPDQSGPDNERPDDHYYRALYAFTPGKRMPFPGFADDQEYRYYYGIARHGGQLPRALAFRTIYEAFTEPLLYRAYSDDEEAPPGINCFDLHPYEALNGAPADYRSDRRGPGRGPRPVGSRLGPQNMVACGWALQALAAFPGIWEKPRAEAVEDVRVPIDDPPPAASGPPAPPARLALGPVNLELWSTRSSLKARGECGEDAASLRFWARSGREGSSLLLSLKKEGAVEAVTDVKERILLTAKVGPRDGGGFRFEFDLPYRAAKGQRAWANAVEHGRMSVEGGGIHRDLLFLSPEWQVKAWLERELGGGLRTWEAVFDRLGYIPTAVGAGVEWDSFSDSGGYAHLLKAGAQWIYCIENKRDWETHRIPRILEGQ